MKHMFNRSIMRKNMMYEYMLLFMVSCYELALRINASEPQCLSRWDYEYKTMRQLTRLEDDHVTIKDTTNNLRGDIERIVKIVDELQMRATGKATYTRYGKTTCPPSASIIYKGYAAGKRHNQSGSGSDTICLPEQPSWRRFQDGNADCCRGYIYGAEIHIKEPSNIFTYPVHAHDLPCSVCLTPHATTLMIPARTDCPSDWTKEYDGYLMAGYYGHSGLQKHVCVDMEPDHVPNGGKYSGEHVVYLVEAQCGSLPCPPYVHGRELACVVCSI